MDFRSTQFGKGRTKEPAPEKSIVSTLTKRDKPKAVPQDARKIIPPKAPRSIAETGLGTVFMRDLLIKTIFRTNLETVSQMSKALCVGASVLNELITICRDQKLIETLGKTGETENSELRYQLTENGKSRAIEAFMQSEYFGALPVPMAMFAEQVERQSVSHLTIEKERLVDKFKGVVISASLLDQIGPAVNSGKSVLFYGPPGNGKSTLAGRIRDAIGEKIYIPRVLEYQGQVISLYDPIVHEQAVEEHEDVHALRVRADRFDARYVLCRRPAVLTGGELRLDMLDLIYNPISKTYQAPLQLKSTGGLFIVDDLGRQVDPPQAMINRWITPMEAGEDILALNSGEKFLVPFDTLVIFSTNFHPKEIFDGAALRRINSKILIDAPNREQLLQIMMLVAKAKNVKLPEEVAIHLFTEKYPSVDNKYAAYQPGFLIEQMLTICAYEGREPQLTPELLDRAWENLFVADSIIEK
ncbi:ATPase [Amylibacter ulvae]|uniref:ATPase n=1 Tax=Paramylibacter ulvae TaxID=1651968 RepID=A0ABQ3D4H0_9RHOB|nr:ATPase [Amylibacter ulvae]GHA50713.1 ATPase [Amylibacter ulvae]